MQVEFQDEVSENEFSDENFDISRYDQQRIDLVLKVADYRNLHNNFNVEPFFTWWDRQSKNTQMIYQNASMEEILKFRKSQNGEYEWKLDAKIRWALGVLKKHKILVLK